MIHKTVSALVISMYELLISYYLWYFNRMQRRDEFIKISLNFTWNTRYSTKIYSIIRNEIAP